MNLAYFQFYGEKGVKSVKIVFFWTLPLISWKSSLTILEMNGKYDSCPNFEGVGG